MGRLPNLTFSSEKDREVSYLEVKVDSIKRRISRSITSRYRGSTSVTAHERLEYLRTMPKNMKPEDSDPDEGGSANQSHYTSESNGKNKRGHGSGNQNTHNTPNGQKVGSYQDGERPEYQRNLNLGPFSEAANEAVQNMLETHKAIKRLADSYAQHSRHIEEIPKIQQQFDCLKKQCEDKDKEIQDLKHAIKTLVKQARESENEVEQEKKNLTRERTELGKERDKAEKFKENAAKRLVMQEAEQKIEQKKELENLKMELKKQFQEREKDLESKIHERENREKQRVATLEEDNSTLRKKLDQLEAENGEHKAKFTKAENKYDLLERATASYKEEAQKLKVELKSMENEFGLNMETTEFYIKKFAEISRTVEQISEQYFKALNSKDTIVDADADTGFAAIPISESAESQNLQMARAQYIISSTLSDIIWQPFSSEKTLSNPDIVIPLVDIATTLAQSSSSGRRAASVWRTLTNRALQSVPATSGGDAPGGDAPPLSRAESVVRKVLSHLAPLVDPTQVPQLRRDLRALADSAISIWSSAQTGELELIVSSSLDRTRRNEWHSLKFDPLPSPSTDSDTTDAAVSSRIFTLFPHVVALKSTRATLAPVGLPGSWPEPDQEPRTIKTCIHSGTGLPERSALVTKGNEEVDLMKTRLEQERIEEQLTALDEQKRQLKALSGKHSRNNSVAGSGVGPPSPTKQWMREGVKRVQED
ncbi:hypothetical protein B7494_g7409 [Chlorociboria aeruginascens]|nr:hypothetical protein B7494_g7409 [Chlorociboria aeruginascens]